jgi:hypothetical protein
MRSVFNPTAPAHASGKTRWQSYASRLAKLSFKEHGSAANSCFIFGQLLL